MWCADHDGPVRVLPDGCMDLLWLGGRLIVAGPDRVAHVHDGAGPERVVGLRFDPGRLPAVLGVPAHVVRDARVPVADLVGSTSGWARAIDPAVDPCAAVDPLAAIEQQLADAPAAHAPPHELVTRITSGRSVAEVASATGYSSRQLHRRCLDAFGYGPSTLRRILRFGAALEDHRCGHPATWVAARHGYADASHLHRDVRELAGVPLSQVS